MMVCLVDAGVGANRGGDIEGDRGNCKWSKHGWRDLGSDDPASQNGDQVRVQVVAPTQFDARQLIELQYDDAEILFGPVRTDLIRAV